MEETLKRNLLWIDGGAGLTAGLLMLVFVHFIASWYRLPLNLLYLIGIANVAYGCFSLTLASRQKRPLGLIFLLIGGNSAWVVFCVVSAIYFRQSASILGLAHLLGEASIVGTLAFLEWRWRESLLRKSPVYS